MSAPEKKMINGELIVDNFAGGGGASTGIELATGVSVDIAINHDPAAIAMHKANHPYTKHYCESVWDVNPIEACNGRSVALAWFSPDCKHFSKAKGGKPKDKNIRGLAWVALRWAGLVRPRIIMLENVEEFKTWGPLNRSHRPIKSKQGVTFRKFISQLEDLGYHVEFKELVAADYGAPTMRKRFFLVARCDGKPIVWPEPTHAPADSEAVKAGLLKPYLGAYTQLDFSLPAPSIFDTAEEIKEKYGIRAVRPLAPKTMERIARGIKKFVIDNAEPFIVPIGYGEKKGQLPRVHDVKEPLPTIVSSGKHYLCEPYMVQCKYDNEAKSIEEPLGTITTVGSHLLVEAKVAPFMGVNTTNHPGGRADEPLHTITTGGQQCLISPTLIQYHSETSKDDVRGQKLDEPLMTVDGSNRYGLVTPFIQKYYGGNYKGNGSDIKEPLHTITTLERNAMCAVSLIQMNNHCDGRDVRKPIPTITAGDGHFGEVRAFLIKYYGQGTGQNIKEPLDTITANDRFGLVTIQGVDYQIVDIGLRMLEPRELYGCQGFPDDYIIDKDHKGNAYPRSEQVKRCGNAVCPPIPQALVRANAPELCIAERMPNLAIKSEPNGQLRFA